MEDDDHSPSDARASRAETARRLRQIAEVLDVPIERFFEPSGGRADDDPREHTPPKPEKGER